MNSYLQAIIGTEILGFLVCAVLLYGNTWEMKRSKSVVYYNEMVVTEMVVLLADVASWFLESRTKAGFWIMATNVIAVTGPILLVGCFVAYIYAHLRERAPVRREPFRAVLIGISVLSIMIFLGSFTGCIFTVRDGAYEEAELYDLYTAANVLAVGAALILVLTHRDTLGRHDAYASYFYLGLPALSGIISMFDEEWLFAIPSGVLSLLVLYVMIQTEERKTLGREKDDSLWLARHDELTGLNSRLAYTGRLEELTGQKERPLGVVFADVNCLKYTNDHYGHQQGDELLRRVASALVQVFDEKDIFRISGDEFVALLPGTEPETLEGDGKKLRDLLRQAEVPLACIGLRCGPCRAAEQLVMLAEEDMYREKQEFYRMFPVYKR